MKAKIIILILCLITALLTFSSCCVDKKVEFNSDEELFLIDIHYEWNRRFKLISDDGKLKIFETLNKDREMLTNKCEACLCGDEFEYYKLTGRNLKLESSKYENNFRFFIEFEIDDAHHQYEIWEQDESYVVFDFEGTPIEFLQIDILHEYNYNDDIVSVVRIVELDEEKNSDIELIFNAELGPIKYTNETLGYYYTKI